MGCMNSGQIQKPEVLGHKNSINTRRSDTNPHQKDLTNRLEWMKQKPTQSYISLNEQPEVFSSYPDVFQSLRNEHRMDLLHFRDNRPEGFEQDIRTQIPFTKLLTYKPERP